MKLKSIPERTQTKEIGKIVYPERTHVHKNGSFPKAFIILWKTRKLRPLFQLKDKVDLKHCCNVVYEGTCPCIGITNRIAG